jgi:hypothetical protein
VDPYNDFLSEGGKLWDTLRPGATEVGCSTTFAQPPRRRAPQMS